MLRNIKVLDLTIYLAGPYCTWILGTLGAEIIKIERPEGGDPSRSLGPFINEESTYFASVNRNKRSLALDLKSPKGRKILERLIAEADILVENLRPGVRQSLGLCDARLHAINPRLIPLSISGYGTTSPHADQPAFDIIAQAMSGMMHMTGQPDGPSNLTGASIGDITAGLFGTINILARLHARESNNTELPSGAIDMSMTDCQMALLENAVSRTCNSNVPVGPIGTRHASAAPFQVFETADSPMVIAVVGNLVWQKFCRVLGKAGKALVNDPRYSEAQIRNQNVDLLCVDLSPILATRKRDDWIADLQAVNIPAAPVNTVAEALNSPHAEARNLLQTVTSQTGNTFDLIKLPFGCDQNEPTAAPTLGQHSESILLNAGYSVTEIAELRAEGVIT
ncbi:MAG: CoA transferase [Rhodospirillales bacterium]|nr:CoA transferase [Rhodospirillales bacterium]